MTQQIRAFIVHTSTETRLTGGHSIHRVDFEGNVFLGWAPAYTEESIHWHNMP